MCNTSLIVNLFPTRLWVIMLKLFKERKVTTEKQGKKARQNEHSGTLLRIRNTSMNLGIA